MFTERTFQCAKGSIYCQDMVPFQAVGLDSGAILVWFYGEGGGSVIHFKTKS